MTDPKLFRHVLGSFPSGVTVVTTSTPEGVRGMTASAFTSLSMDPPLVLVCVARKAHLHGALSVGHPLAISILGEDQGPISNHFAGFAPDVVPSFEEGRVVPVIAGAIARIEGSVHALQDGGDHTIVVVRVEGLATNGGAPLLYLRGKYGRFAQNTS